MFFGDMHVCDLEVKPMEGVPEEMIQEIAAWNSTSGHKQVDMIMASIMSRPMVVILRSPQSMS